MALVQFKELGLLDYRQALDIQTKTLSAKMNNPEIPDTIFLVEHPSVFTLGKNGGKENLIVSKDFLDSKGIDIVQAQRGGNITFHCPGQAVMYPVLDLTKNRIGVKDLVHDLEKLMKLTARDFGVQAERNPKNHGIWVKNKKVGSIGLGIKKGICFHGIALNINPDLTPFSWINACGMSDVSTTSLKQEIQIIDPDANLKTLSITKANVLFKKHFCAIFDFYEQ